MGLGITSLSIVLHFVATILALRITIVSRRLVLLPLALAILLMGIRRSYSLYNSLSFEQPIDAGAESIALVISLLTVIGLLGFRRLQVLQTSTDVSGKVLESQLPSGLARSAIVLDGLVVVISCAVGYSSYSSSRELLLDSLYGQNLTLARAIAAQAELGSGGRNEVNGSASLITDVEATWEATATPFQNCSVCVLDQRGTVLLHTAAADLVGQSILRVPLETRTESGTTTTTTVGDLLSAPQEWVGTCVTPNGESELVAFVPMSSEGRMLAVHIPMVEIEAATRIATLP